jgi:polyribonucleotide nucleotidyltransferase
MDYGALLELQPSGLRALLHISDISAERVRSIDDVVKMGQSLEVMCVGRDQKGQVRLSRKAVLARHTARQQASQNVARSGGIDADK